LARVQSPSSLRADARRNRETLLRVATAAFARDGLSVPLDEIARRAGVGPGTLYRHFPTKDALLEAVLLDRLRRLVDDVRALRGTDHPGSALLDFIDRLVAEAAGKQDLVEALAKGGADLTATLGASTAQLRRELGRLLSRAQASGTIRDDITLADFMAMVSGLLFSLRTRSARRANPKRAVAVLRDGLRAARVDTVRHGAPGRIRTCAPASGGQCSIP
jgi:AcrR family transcriptional regulator